MTFIIYFYASLLTVATIATGYLARRMFLGWCKSARSASNAPLGWAVTSAVACCAFVAALVSIL